MKRFFNWLYLKFTPEVNIKCLNCDKNISKDMVSYSMFCEECACKLGRRWKG